MARPHNLNNAQRAERRIKAYELRLKGKSYRAIGEALGISHQMAMIDVKEQLASIELPLADEVRKQEIDRLTRYLDKLEFRVEQGDDKAVALGIKISESLRKLLGIDIPVTQQIAVTETTQKDLEIMDLINSVRAKNALEKARITLDSPEKGQNAPSDVPTP